MSDHCDEMTDIEDFFKTGFRREDAEEVEDAVPIPVSSCPLIVRSEPKFIVPVDQIEPLVVEFLEVYRSRRLFKAHELAQPKKFATHLNAMRLAVEGHSKLEPFIEAALRQAHAASSESLWGTFNQNVVRGIIQINPRFSRLEDISRKKIDLFFFDELNQLWVALAVKSSPWWGNTSSWTGQDAAFGELKNSPPALAGKGVRQRILAVMFHPRGDKGIQKSNKYPSVDYIVEGQIAWEVFSGNADLLSCLMRLARVGAKEHHEAIEASLQDASRGLFDQFGQLFCKADGEIDWEKLQDFTSASVIEANQQEDYNLLMGLE
jgi:hypothetical protein